MATDATRTPARPPFDAVTIAAHWLTALLVAAAFAAGWVAHSAQDAAASQLMLMVHRSLGVGVWTVSLLRLGWRLTAARFPPFPASMPKPQQWAAKASEYGLYLLLLAQPATGLLQSLYRGKPFPLFGALQVPALVGRDKMLIVAFHEVHEWGAWAFLGLIGLHAAAGLLHAMVLRDGVFESMAPLGRRRRAREAAAARP